MREPGQKKDPGGNHGSKGGKNVAGATPETSHDSGDNARTDYSGKDKRRSKDIKSKLKTSVDPCQENIIPFYDAYELAHLHDYESERGLIGTFFLDPGPPILGIGDLDLPNPVDLFADKRHREIYRISAHVMSQGQGMDLIMFQTALKREVDAGRTKPGLVSMTYVSNAMESAPSPANWPYYLEGVISKYKERKTRQITSRQWESIASDPNGPGDINESLDSLVTELEKLRSLDAAGSKKKVSFATWDQVTRFEPPKGFQLLDRMMLARGQMTVLAGYPGTGKSMLSLWLAALAATGAGEFMGHEILTRFRTLILQNENGLFPLKERFQGIQSRFPDFDFSDWIRISEPPEDGLAIANPDFRRAVKNEIRSFDPGLVIIDPFTNLVSDLGHKDYSEALDYIREIIPERADQPALLIVAHCRKRGNGAKRAKGRALLNEIIGSQALGSRTRSAWAIDAATDDVEDERVVVQDIKNNNGALIGPSAWLRGVGWFDELADFDFDEYLNSDNSTGSGNAKDEKAWTILYNISNGDPTGFNKWHEACKAEGLYKSKASFNPAVKRLLESGRVQRNEASKLYQVVMEDGAFWDD